MKTWAIQPMFLAILMGGNLGCSPSSPSHTRWFAILATQTSIADAVIELKQLGGRAAGLELVSTEDCRNLQPDLFLVVVGVFGDRQSAAAATDSWRTKGVDDAAVQSCDIRELGRLGSGIPLLHPSFDVLHTQPVNWGMDDAVSRIEHLDNGRIVLIVPYYEADPEDIREGLRIRVLLHRPQPDQSLSLSADCIDPELATNLNYLALSCVTESAADHLLHRIRVFNLDDGRELATHDRCREPRFRGKVLFCKSEAVDAEGALSLEEREYRLHE